jgi:hypothetical protein
MILQYLKEEEKERVINEKEKIEQCQHTVEVLERLKNVLHSNIPFDSKILNGKSGDDKNMKISNYLKNLGKLKLIRDLKSVADEGNVQMEYE